MGKLFSLFSKQKNGNTSYLSLRERTKIQLLDSLKPYNVQHLIDLFMDFIYLQNTITTKNIMEMLSPNSDDDYITYCHKDVIGQCQMKQQPFKVIKNNNGYSPEFKVTIIGAGGVGKSSLTIRFVTDKWVECYDPTIEDSYRRHRDINGQNILFDILDTAGQQEFTSLRDQYLREARLYMICFAVNDKDGWDRRDILRNKVLRYKDIDDGKNGGPFMLVITKCDLRDIDCNNCIPREEMVKQADEWDVSYIETSAKLGKNINFAFKQAAFECIFNEERT